MMVSKKGLLHLIAGLGILLLLMVLYIKTQAAAPEKHTRFVENLRQLKQLDANLNQTILELRYGLLRHYDPLVKIWRDIEQQQAALDSALLATHADEQSDIRHHREAVAQVMREKETMSEYLKSQLAVLRNSQNFLLNAISQVLVQLPTGGDGAILAQNLRQLERETLVYYLTGNEELCTRLNEDILDLERMSQRLSPAPRQSIVNLLGHLRIALEVRGEVDQLVSDLMVLPISQRLDALHDRYDIYYEGILRRANDYRLMLFLLSVLLLGYIVFTLFRLKRMVTRLRKTEVELMQHREHLEALVQSRTHALEATNKELESFSYSVSHDLRAPLRAINGFSEALLEDCQEQLDATGKDYLLRITNSAHRMGGLIDDLLALSRFTRHELNLLDVDMSTLAGAVIAELKAGDPARTLDINIIPGIMAYGDKNMLRVVLSNLLGNAWKYTSRNDSAKIEFGLELRDGEKVYYVRDNGVGFDMAHADKLFGAFQRLHRSDEFEGSGIGLATVQRVIYRHGGKIWAEARVGQGASFYFMLPERGLGA